VEESRNKLLSVSSNLKADLSTYETVYEVIMGASRSNPEPSTKTLATLTVEDISSLKTDLQTSGIEMVKFEVPAE
jgi:hypothetical protein